MTHEALENLLHEGRRFPPSPEFAAQANATAALYDEAAADRLGVLGGAGARARVGAAVGHGARLVGARRSRSGSSAGGSTSSVNCVDRHVAAGHGDQVAIHFEGEPGDTRDVTYADLLREVSPGGERADRAGRDGRATGWRSTCR